MCAFSSGLLRPPVLSFECLQDERRTHLALVATIGGEHRPSPSKLPAWAGGASHALCLWSRSSNRWRLSR